MEYDPAEVPELIEPIVRGAADVVFGSRLRGGKPQRAFLFWHLVGNRFLSLRHERPLQHDALGHGDRLQGVPASTCSARSTCARTASGSSPRSPGKVCKRKLRIYELPISYYGRTHDEGKKITWRDGFRALWVLVPRPARRHDLRRQDARASSSRRTTRRG